MGDNAPAPSLLPLRAPPSENPAGSDAAGPGPGLPSSSSRSEPGALLGHPEGGEGQEEGNEEVVDSRPSDADIIAQENAIRAEAAEKLEFVGDKEPLSVLGAEYERGNQVILAKIQRLGESYGAIRRARGDGNCFFRSFMFAYLEKILEAGDEREVERVMGRVDRCKKLLVGIGYAEFTWDEFLDIFLEQLEGVRPTSKARISLDTLLERCRDPNVSNYVVMFFRFVTSSEIQTRADFFEPFIMGTTELDVVKFCRTLVEPMGEESDHIHITALTDALGVPIRVVYLDRSTSGSDSSDVNNHDFFPESPSDSLLAPNVPYIHLLYRPGHYDILYKK